MRNSVKNIIQVNSLQSKLGSDIVTDETNFHRWLAMSSFEKSFNKAVEEFANLYSDDLKIAKTAPGVAAPRTVIGGSKLIAYCPPIITNAGGKSNAKKSKYARRVGRRQHPAAA